MLQDIDLMLFVSASFAEVGKYKLAKGALVAAERQDSNIIKNQYYKEIVEYILANEKPD